MGVNLATTPAWCAKTLARTVRHARHTGMLQDIDAIAIDVTDIPYHGEQLQEHTRKSRPRAGTSTFLSYVAVHGVGRDSSQIVLESQLLPAKEKLADFIAKTRTKILRGGGAHSKTVFLYDRAFYSADCMTEAGKGGCRYIMPVIMNSKIKRIVKMYKDGKASQVSQQSMTNKDGVTVTYNLVIVKRDRKKKKKGEGEEEEEQYIAFATNIPIRSARAMTGIIPEQYRKMGHRDGVSRHKGDHGQDMQQLPVCEAADVLPAAAALLFLHKLLLHHRSVRLLMFYLPLLLYNLWRIARFCLDAGKRHGRVSSAGKKLTMALFIVYITSRNELFVNDRGK